MRPRSAPALRIAAPARSRWPLKNRNAIGRPSGRPPHQPRSRGKFQETAALSWRSRRPRPGDIREAGVRRAVGETDLRHSRSDDGVELAITAAGDAEQVQHRVDLGGPAGAESLNPFE